MGTALLGPAANSAEEVKKRQMEARMKMHVSRLCKFLKRWLLLVQFDLHTDRSLVEYIGGVIITFARYEPLQKYQQELMWRLVHCSNEQFIPTKLSEALVIESAARMLDIEDDVKGFVLVRPDNTVLCHEELLDSVNGKSEEQAADGEEENFAANSRWTLELEAKTIAETITMWLGKYFMAIPLSELQKKNFIEPSTAPHLFKFVKCSNQLSNYVTVEVSYILLLVFNAFIASAAILKKILLTPFAASLQILKKTANVKTRAQVVERFIDVASQLLTHRNYFAIFAVVSAMQVCYGSTFFFR